MNTFEIKCATVDDVPVMLRFIKELAEYEKLSHEVVATEISFYETLFGERAYIMKAMSGCLVFSKTGRN